MSKNLVNEILDNDEQTRVNEALREADMYTLNDIKNYTDITKIEGEKYPVLLPPITSQYSGIKKNDDGFAAKINSEFNRQGFAELPSMDNLLIAGGFVAKMLQYV